MPKLKHNRLYFQFCNSSPLLQQRISTPNAQPDLGLSGLQNVLCNQASYYNSDHHSLRQAGCSEPQPCKSKYFHQVLSSWAPYCPSLPFKHSPPKSILFAFPKALCPLLGPLRAPPPKSTELLKDLHKAGAASSTGLA